MGRVRTWLAGLWSEVRHAVGVRELHVYGGLALASYGLAGLNTHVALGVVGAMLVYMGLFHRQRR